ncbi:MAG TPA: CotH kinase family protein [Polyangiaceae bacterium]|nr:CotH kinase family protein [Polyangiaceae bacterium]
MYHPYGETSAQEEHEFVELFNAGKEPALLSGYKLRVDGRDRLSLPANLSLGPGQYLVLAKSASALLSISSYMLEPSRVIGDYSGELDNGGAEVALVSARGNVLDSVTYDDAAPWPIGADAFGADEEFLPALAPFDAHRFRGRSLERVDLTGPSSAPATWEASAIDAATPGRANAATRTAPIALTLTVVAAGSSSGTISPTTPAQIEVTLSGPPSEVPVVEYRVDVLGLPGSSSASLSLEGVPAAAGVYRAILPAAPANSVVRYRIKAGPASDAARISPRLGDPNEWHSYFVEPPTEGTQFTSSAQRLFIAPGDWTSLWTNLDGGQNMSCTINAKWDAEVPAVFVASGKVYDVRVRYQGSRNRRKDGLEIENFPAAGPSQPDPLLALSFHVSFPNYAEYDGENSINLNKLKQACPGVLNALEGALFDQVGVPAQNFRFTRVYVNGAYYTYSMEVRGIDARTMRKYEGKGNPIGLLFKADGDNSNGPWGLANFTPLNAACGAPVSDRYLRSYELHTHKELIAGGQSHTELVSLIEELNRLQANSDANPEVRAFFERNFDVSELATQFAIRNWAGVWDDGFHNYYLYKRPSDGKWLILPQDFDCDFGGDPVQCGDFGKFYNAPTLSFFHPERSGGVTAVATSRLKIQFIRAFRAEFSARVIELGKTIFSESNIDSTLTRVLSAFDLAAWNAAPTRYCDVNARVQQAKEFLAKRRAFLAEGIK